LVNGGRWTGHPTFAGVTERPGGKIERNAKFGIDFFSHHVLINVANRELGENLLGARFGKVVRTILIALSPNAHQSGLIFRCI
jgi:hypothetical protein